MVIMGMDQEVVEMQGKIIRYVLILCLVILAIFVTVDIEHIRAFINPIENTYKSRMKQELLCLMLAYPEHITGIERNDDNYVYIIMKSGKRILYDDKKVKTTEEKIENPDLQDMMEQFYPLEPIGSLMDEDFDPGRSRVYPLLEEVYGESKQQIESNLTYVKVGWSSFQFNQRNGAANALKAVMEELIPLCQSSQRIMRSVLPSGGTYNYRVISGTNRLSAHAFGIAIDLSRDNRDYWQWASRDAGQHRLEEYPQEIVEIFEKNNFIWGGKWGHFDFLHFEYRPEIIMLARYFGKGNGLKKMWYEGAPTEDAFVKDCIMKIDEALS